jgi:hypothetical protein
MDYPVFTIGVNRTPGGWTVYGAEADPGAQQASPSTAMIGQ